MRYQRSLYSRWAPEFLFHVEIKFVRRFFESTDLWTHFLNETQVCTPNKFYQGSSLYDKGNEWHVFPLSMAHELPDGKGCLMYYPVVLRLDIRKLSELWSQQGKRKLLIRLMEIITTLVLDRFSWVSISWTDGVWLVSSCLDCNALNTLNGSFRERVCSV